MALQAAHGENLVKAKRKAKASNGLYTFSLQTNLPITTCLHKVKVYPTVGVSGKAVYRLQYKMRLDSISEKTNSFRLTVYNSVAVLGNLHGASTTVHLKRIGDVTVVKGRIHNLKWKYQVFAAMPILFLFAAFSLANGQLLGAAGLGILLPMLLYYQYTYQTQKFRDMLIAGIQARLGIINE